ncbi:TolC family protein [Pseudolysobacter antarcticus]|uniref:TolC family protein n=1 Tax=Pseudolysobacter antarcticus TaxID=2511995 RepID=A0A411HF40_9GAMM|nr:TolC family protein [Pseudolysobacter antarcticus]QBB69100.1 TolC family protein [Pseudolysobacter antarcticus]
MSSPVRARRRACWAFVFASACFTAAVLAQSNSSAVTSSDSATALIEAPPALSHALREVWARNPAVQAAQAKVAAQYARADAAQQPLYNPEIEVLAQRADVNTRSVGISQAIDWSGKRRARADVGDAELRAAEAERDQVLQQIGLQWLSGFSAYQVAAAQVALGNERIRLLQQFADLAQRRFAAGDIPSLERDLAQLALLEARTQLAELLANQAQARRTIAAVGADANALPELPRVLPPPLPTAIATASIEGLPTIRLARANSEIAQARITVAERERHADPVISISAGRVDSGPLRDNLIGVSLRIPLFVRNNYRAEVTAAYADVDQADASLRDQLLRAKAQASEAADTYNALHEAWAGWESSHAPRIAERAILLQRLWQAGELGTSDYLVQLTQSIDTELGATGLRARAWQAWADWLAASGGLNIWLHGNNNFPSPQE